MITSDETTSAFHAIAGSIARAGVAVRNFEKAMADMVQPFEDRVSVEDADLFRRVGTIYVPVSMWYMDQNSIKTCAPDKVCNTFSTEHPHSTCIQPARFIRARLEVHAVCTEQGTSVCKLSDIIVHKYNICWLCFRYLLEKYGAA